MTTTRVRPGSAEIRERLLDAGMDLFHTQSYNGTGVQEITSAAGVPKGSFYNHFDSKQGLAIAALERYAAQSPLDLLMNPDTPPLAAVRGHFEELGRRFAVSGYQRGCMMGNFANEVADRADPVRVLLAGLFDAWVQVVADVIAQAQQGGQVASALPAEQLAGMIVSAWEGSLTRARACGDAGPVDTFFTVVFDQLLAGPSD